MADTGPRSAAAVPASGAAGAEISAAYFRMMETETVQAKIITIPFDSDKQVFHDDDLNAFLGGRRVTRMKTE